MSDWSLGDFLPEFSSHDSGSYAEAFSDAFADPMLALSMPMLPFQFEGKLAASDIPDSYGCDVVGWGELRDLMSELRSEHTLI